MEKDGGNNISAEAIEGRAETGTGEEATAPREEYASGVDELEEEKNSRPGESLDSAGRIGRAVSNGLRGTFTQPQRAFLVIGLLFGLLMVFFNPPLRVADEQIHLFKSYGISEGHILAERHGVSAGGSIPKSFLSTVDKLKLIPFSDFKLKLKDLTSSFKVPLKNKDKYFIDYSYWAILSYSPIPYLPQATGVEVGKILNLSPVVMLYLGRIFNLLCWLALIYFAIRITPVQKWVFFLAALIPRSVNLGASLSADSFTIAFCFLVIAFFLNLAFDKDKSTIERRDIVILCLFAIVLALMKPPCFLLIFLFALIPLKKLRSKKEYFAVFALIVLIAIVVAGSWYVIGSRGSRPQMDTISMGRQLSFIESHPDQFVLVTVRTVRSSIDLWIGGLIGTLGWFEVRLPQWFIYTYFFLLIGIAAVDNDEIRIQSQKKAYIFLILAGSLLAFLGIGYLAATPVGQTSVIEGFQPRYLIPFAPLFFLLFNNQSIKYEKGKYFYIGIICFSLFSTALTIFKVVSTYFV